MRLYKWILVVILCTLALWLSKPLFVSKSIIVTANIETEKPFIAQVFYTKKNGKEFNEKQSIKTEVHSGKSQLKIKLPINHLHKFRFDIGSAPGKVKISNFKLKGKEKHLLNFNAFSWNQIENHDITNDSVILFSNKPDPYMMYKPILNLKGRSSIDWCLFIILLCGYWFVFSKCIGYLAKFKLLEKHSRIDIVFLAIFFGLLFIPMLSISDAEKSEQENRMLATKPQLIDNGRINNNFGTVFNNWFSDRFWGRNFLLNLYGNVKHFMGSKLSNKKVLIGQEGWLFFLGDNGLNNYANTPELDEKKMAKGLAYLQAIDNWCKKYNKKFYYVIIPDKSKVYGQYYRLINKQRSDDYGIAQQFVNYIRKNSKINVLYLRQPLLNHKHEGLLYYKQGTHWSELGSYWGWQSIWEQISHDTPIKKIIVDDWKYSNPPPGETWLAQQINIDEEKRLYHHFDFGEKALCRYESTSKRKGDGLVMCENNKNKYNVFVLRDSFFSWLIPYIANTFKQAKILWKFNMEIEDLVDIKENYDIVIFENVERYVPAIFQQSFPNLSKE